MHAEYQAFAQAALHQAFVGPGDFVATCAKAVACKQFGQEFDVIKYAIACLLHPTHRVFDVSVLIKHSIIPFGNDSEAYMFMTQTLGLKPPEIGLMKDGCKIKVCLSLKGLNKCAAVFTPVHDALVHAQMIITTFQESKKRQELRELRS